MENLFVYGTLMRGQDQEGLVAHLPVQAAFTRGALWRAPAGYPALEFNAGGAQIVGEVLTLPDPSMFIVLDLYEGIADGLYTRTRIPVQTEEGISTAWAYTMNAQQLRRAGCRRMELTDWRKTRRRV